MDNDDIKSLRTRCGYIPSESIQTFEKNLMDGNNGGITLGKCIHFGIDLIVSGGLHSFFKIIWGLIIFEKISFLISVSVLFIIKLGINKLSINNKTIFLLFILLSTL